MWTMRQSWASKLIRRESFATGSTWVVCQLHIIHTHLIPDNIAYMLLSWQDVLEAKLLCAGLSDHPLIVLQTPHLRYCVVGRFPFRIELWLRDMSHNPFGPKISNFSESRSATRSSVAFLFFLKVPPPHLLEISPLQET